MNSDSPANDPDLIQAIATNGVTGYVLKADLEEANGTAASKTFKTPEDAVRWQQNQGQGDKTIPVYAQDGKTRVGVFVIAGVGVVEAVPDSK